MKKKLLALVLIMCMLIVSAGILTACKNDVTYTYSLNETQKTLLVGEEFTLTATSEPEKTLTATYSSDNSAIATVSDAGLVKAIAAGDAVIKVTVDGQELTCAVKVTQSYTYTLSETQKNLPAGTKFTLSVTSVPAKTLAVTYASSNNSIATVNTSGQVTGVALGDAVITATVDGEELTCNVKVVVNYAGLEDVSITTVQTKQITITCNPTNYSPELTYETANQAIATVNSTGLISGVGVGNTKINVKDKGVLVKAINVEVAQGYIYNLNFTEKSLEIGETFDLDVIVTPEKTIQAGNLTFVSEDEEIATVHSGTGGVEGIAEGPVNIVVTVDGIELVCEVTVNAPLVKATSSWVSAPEKYNLSADQIGLKVSNWLYFSGRDTEDDRKTVATTDIVAEIPRTEGFWDYSTKMYFNDGSRASFASRRGVISSKPGNENKYKFTVTLNKNISQIRVFTGAWNATSLMAIYYDGKVIESRQITADSTANTGYIIFNLDVSGLTWDVTHKVVIEIQAISGEGHGNASIVAIQTLDADATIINAGATATADFDVSAASGDYVMDTYGDVDWELANGERKADSANLAELSYRVGFEGWTNDGDDYGGNLKYGDNQTTHDFKWNAVSIDAKATITAGQTVTIFTSAWKANSAMIVFDENHNIVGEIVLEADRCDHNRPKVVQITIDTAGTYTFALYNIAIADGENVGIAGIAIKSATT